MNFRFALLILAVAVMAGFAGAAAWRMLGGPGGAAPVTAGDLRSAGVQSAEDIVGQRRPDYTLGGSGGERVNAADFDGQVVLVNFWATWCTPCREEMPMLADLYRERVGDGLQIVGIALDDVAAARSFAAELGIDYPILVGSTDVMAVVRLYGNVSGVLPYSVLIDREGIIRWAYLGELKEPELRAELDALLSTG